MPDAINGLWIGESLGPLERLSIASFLANGHEYRLYCYQRPQGVPRGTTVCDAAEILPESAIFRFQGDEQGNGWGKGSLAPFSDLFRYKLLAERGGWWCDTDMVCLRPFEFASPVVFGAENDETGKPSVAIGAMRLPAGHPIARELYEEAVAHRSQPSWGATGPKLLTRIIERHNAWEFVMAPPVFYPLLYRECWTLIEPDPAAAKSGFTDQTIGVHLWHEQWRSAGLDKNPTYPPTSLLAELFDRYDSVLSASEARQSA